MRTRVQTGSCHAAAPAVDKFAGRLCCKANSAVLFVLSLQVAGKQTNNTHVLLIGFLIRRLSFCFVSVRSSPAEARDGQAVEGERLGKRVRRKRKIYMDSGDEEEDNQEEPEVS